MSSQGFWTTVSNQADPKRKFRFKVSVTGLADSGGPIMWWAKTAAKPSFRQARSNCKGSRA